MAPPDGFKHAPLRDSSSEIRLLKLTELGRRVSCQLTTWPLSSVPVYYALSYTWGDAALSTLIFVNDERMTVRQNCEYALRQVFSSEPECFLWVDAICIDQESTQEKNHQVAMMGSIYSNATHVFACVGAHTEDSELLFKTMDNHKSLLESICEHFTRPDAGGLKGWNIPNPISKARWLSLKCFFTMNSESRKCLAQAVITFLERPYFGRLWVLQELHLATKGSFCCGMDIRPFDRLLAVSLLVDFWINQRDYMLNWSFMTKGIVSFVARQPKIFRRQKSCDPLFEEFSMLKPRRGCLALTSGIRRPRRLSEVLDEMEHFQCADARDKLYGIISLVGWVRGGRPDPDYAKDRFEVCVMVLELYLKHSVLAPQSGTYVEWARRLCDIFEISPWISSVQKALENRCSPSKLPETISSPGSFISVKGSNSCQLSEGPKLSFFMPHSVEEKTTKPDYQNAWFGAPLRHAHDITHDLSSIDLDGLYIRDPASAVDTSTLGFQAIVTGRGKLVALAPAHVHVGDWLVASASEFYPTKESIGLIIRLVTRENYLEYTSGIYKREWYAIIGQAALENVPVERKPRRDYWKSFETLWSAEDLLVLNLAFFYRRSCEPSGTSLVDWLNLRTCKTTGSSQMLGPYGVPFGNFSTPYALRPTVRSTP
jgi:hypothetical protein